MQIEFAQKNELKYIKRQTQGGVSLKKRRKIKRPLVPNKITHLVLKSSKATGELSFYKHKALVHSLLKRRAARIYLKLLAVLYFIGCVLHLMDLFGQRLHFFELSKTWQVWIVYLLIFDLFAAIGLWRGRTWVIGLFLLIAISQLMAYTGFQNVFGDQTFLIVFHLSTLTVFVALYFRGRSNSPNLCSTPAVDE